MRRLIASLISPNLQSHWLSSSLPYSELISPTDQHLGSTALFGVRHWQFMTLLDRAPQHVA
jgi:hypothetical protein